MRKDLISEDKNHHQQKVIANPLEEILKEGARRLLQEAIENEVEEYIQMFLSERGETGKRACFLEADTHADRRRSPGHQRGAFEEGHRETGLQRRPHQGESDRHRFGDARLHASRSGTRHEPGHFPSFRRNHR